MTDIALSALAAYLLGNLPSGLLAARAFGLADPRRIGSGNIGATNVLRTGHRLAALLTLAGDAGKGAAAVLLARAFAGEDAAAAAAGAAMLGHVFPALLGFRGGKGVATFLGAAVAMSLPAGLLACAAWLAAAAAFRYSSLSALAASALAPVLALALDRWQDALATALMAALLWARHAGNIRRLMDGTEPRIGESR